MFAPANGEILSQELARDFWPSKRSDLWNSKQDVALRWWKLCFVYFASVVVQILIPAALVVAVVLLVRGGDWIGVIISLVVGSILGVPLALFVATRAYFGILRQRTIRESEES